MRQQSVSGTLPTVPCTQLTAEPSLHRVEQMGPEIVYVSGRTRAPGEMNGKSSNLNNAMNQIYPDDLIIPPNELVCIFDADQASHGCLGLRAMPLLCCSVTAFAGLFSWS